MCCCEGQQLKETSEGVLLVQASRLDPIVRLGTNERGRTDCLVWRILSSSTNEDNCSWRVGSRTNLFLYIVFLLSSLSTRPIFVSDYLAGLSTVELRFFFSFLLSFKVDPFMQCTMQEVLPCCSTAGECVCDRDGGAHKKGVNGMQ